MTRQCQEDWSTPGELTLIITSPGREFVARILWDDPGVERKMALKERELRPFLSIKEAMRERAWDCYYNNVEGWLP